MTGRCHLLRFAKLFFVSLRFSMNLSSLNPLSAALAPPLTPCGRTHCRMRLLPFSFTKHSPLSPLLVAERNSPRPPAPRWAPSLLLCAPTESSVWHKCVCECPFVDSAWMWRVVGGGQCGVGWWWCLGRRLAATACAPLWLCVLHPQMRPK